MPPPPSSAASGRPLSRSQDEGGGAVRGSRWGWPGAWAFRSRGDGVCPRRAQECWGLACSPDGGQTWVMSHSSCTEAEGAVAKRAEHGGGQQDDSVTPTQIAALVPGQTLMSCHPRRSSPAHRFSVSTHPDLGKTGGHPAASVRISAGPQRGPVPPTGSAPRAAPGGVMCAVAEEEKRERSRSPPSSPGSAGPGRGPGACGWDAAPCPGRGAGAWRRVRGRSTRPRRHRHAAAPRVPADELVPRWRTGPSII